MWVHSIFSLFIFTIFLLFKFNYIIEVYLQFSHDFLLICASHEHVYLWEIWISPIYSMFNYWIYFFSSTGSRVRKGDYINYRKRNDVFYAQTSNQNQAKLPRPFVRISKYIYFSSNTLIACGQMFVTLTQDTDY